MSGIAIRYLKEYDIEVDQHPIHITWIPASIYYPLSGHRGDCAKVTTATVTGKTDACCTCGKDATP